MRFERLCVERFRNLHHVELVPDPRFNVIAGPNGHGKTNLLEAIYILASLKSFRGQRNRDLIQHELDDARVSGAFERAGARRDVAVTIHKRGKKVELNGKAVRSLSDFFGAVNTVVFTPDDIGVVKGGPGDRRLFVDRMIFNAHAAYASEVSDYESALKQRNRLLKDDRPERAVVAAFEEPLVRHGAQVVRRRRAFVERFAAPFAAAFQEIFGATFTATLDYAPNWLGPDPVDDADLEEAFAARLSDTWNRDQVLGHTTAGPHRDDYDARINDYDVRTFASQGQQRAFILAAKVSEIRLLATQFGHYPILLLDDVSSELDPQRNAKLFEFISSIEAQVFITTTDREFLRLSSPFSLWPIREGALIENAASSG